MQTGSDLAAACLGDARKYLVSRFRRAGACGDSLYFSISVAAGLLWLAMNLA